MFNSIPISLAWYNINSILGDSIQPISNQALKPQICFASQPSLGTYLFGGYLIPKITSPSYPVRTVMFLFDSLTTTDPYFASLSHFSLNVGNEWGSTYGKNYVFSI
jgi:hypothetical protein